MSGIAGQIRFDGESINQCLMEKMGDLLEHRGRDGRASYVNGAIGLTIQKLLLEDVSSSEHQIVSSQENKVLVLLDGFIINAKELKAELSISEEVDDTKLVLQGYIEYGTDIFDRIDGIFAVAILDLRQQRLILGRDRVGAKPLYYHQSSNDISFASEIKALIKSGCVKASVNEIALKEYISMQMYVDDHTLFNGIWAVLPAHYLDINIQERKVSQHCYWERPCDKLNISYEEAVEELLGLLDSSLEKNCRLRIPYGAFVSGGLDSSTVATIASHHTDITLHGALKTYSSVYPDMNFDDEQFYSDAVVKAIRSEHKRIRLSDEEVIKDHENLIYMLDMPCAGFSAPYRTLARHVRRDVKTVLTGHGGDEFFCGYPKTLVAALATALNDAKLGKNFNFDTKLLPYLEHFEPLTRSFMGSALFKDERALVQELMIRGNVVRGATSDSLGLKDAEYELTKKIVEKMESAGEGIIRKMMYIDQTVELPNLLHVEDRTHMAENLETRIPMLSRSILEFALRLPEEFFIKKGLKGMLRSTGQKILPAVVANKMVKSGTMFPVQELFFGRMYSEVQKKIAVLDDMGWFDRSVKEMIKDSSIEKREVWALWSLACWVENFLC